MKIRSSNRGKRMTQHPAPAFAGRMNQSSGQAPKTASGPAFEVNADSQSVAGEEDPGAALDMSGATGSMPTGSVNPGDEAPEGTPGTG